MSITVASLSTLTHYFEWSSLQIHTFQNSQFQQSCSPASINSLQIAHLSSNLWTISWLSIFSPRFRLNRGAHCSALAVSLSLLDLNWISNIQPLILLFVFLYFCLQIPTRLHIIYWGVIIIARHSVFLWNSVFPCWAPFFKCLNLIEDFGSC